MKYANALDDLKENTISAFEKYSGIEDQKEFALSVKKFPYSGILFSMRQGKTYHEAFDSLTQNGKYRLLGVKS